MWTTTLCHPSAFVKLSVTMATLQHCNCPSDSQVYIAKGSCMLSGPGQGVNGGRCRGNRQKGRTKGAGGGETEGEGELKEE